MVSVNLIKEWGGRGPHLNFKIGKFVQNFLMKANVLFVIIMIIGHGADFVCL